MVLGLCKSFVVHLGSFLSENSDFQLAGFAWKWPKNDPHWPKTWSFIFSSCSSIQNTCLCEVCSHLLNNCSRYYIFSRLLRFFTFEIFPILTRVAQAFKKIMLNKSGYFRTADWMKKSTALDFWRKSEKPEMESYIIYHDFGKI